jgi:hypothetical protein
MRASVTFTAPSGRHLIKVYVDELIPESFPIRRPREELVDGGNSFVAIVTVGVEPEDRWFVGAAFEVQVEDTVRRLGLHGTHGQLQLKSGVHDKQREAMIAAVIHQGFLLK